MKLEEALKDKRPKLANRKGIVFNHDNARLHTLLATRTKLLELGWEVMSHPPYSPDLASSNYHLFRSLQNFSNGKMSVIMMTSNRTWLSFLLLRTRNSIQCGIIKWPERWEKGHRTEWMIFDWLKFIFV